MVSCGDRWFVERLMRAIAKASVGNRFNKASTTTQSVGRIERFDVYFKRHGWLTIVCLLQTSALRLPLPPFA